MVNDKLSYGDQVILLKMYSIIIFCYGGLIFLWETTITYLRALGFKSSSSNLTYIDDCSK